MTSILIVADTSESQAMLSGLLTNAGFSVTLAEDADAPPTTDIIIADVTRIMFGPYNALQAQRRLGTRAPAMVLAPRITDQMASEMFALDVRDFVLKPVNDETLLERIFQFAALLKDNNQQEDIGQSLSQTEASFVRRLEEMNMVSRIGRVVSSQTDLDTILSQIVDAAVYLTHAQEGAIFLVDEYGGLNLRAEKGFGAGQTELTVRPSQDSDAMEVLRTGQPIMRRGDGEHKLMTGILVRALINVPILIGRNVAGVVAVYNQGTASFDEADRSVLVSLSDYAAMALEKIRVLKDLQAQMEGSLVAYREILYHIDTLLAPIEGIESLASTLLQNGFGPLNEQQADAVRRIENATVRLHEITEFIQQAAANAEPTRSTR